MSFDFTVLGSIAALPSLGKHPAAHVLNVHEQFYLIDGGEGVQVQLKRYGFNALRINHIFISHLHGDHFYGIYGLISSMSLLGRKTPLHIYAPAPIKQIIATHLDFFENNIAYKIVCVEIDTTSSSLIYENKVMEVYTIPLKHKIPTAGFLFKEKEPSLNVYKESIEFYKLSIKQVNAAKRGEDITLDSGELVPNHRIAYRPYKARSFAYCSDTAATKDIVPLIKGIDLLYHESTFLDADKKIAYATGHSTAKSAGYIAKISEVGRLLIGHFSMRYKEPISVFEIEAKQNFDNTSAVKEGEKYTIVRSK